MGFLKLSQEIDGIRFKLVQYLHPSLFVQGLFLWRLVYKLRRRNKSTFLKFGNILLRYAIIFPGLLAAEIWFWANFKISFTLAQHSQTKMRTGIAFQHQDACSVAGRRLHSSDNDNNQVYVKIIDNFYVIVHAKVRRNLMVSYFKLN